MEGGAPHPPSVGFLMDLTQACEHRAPLWLCEAGSDICPSLLKLEPGWDLSVFSTWPGRTGHAC